jgi:hypothetical protein
VAGAGVYEVTFVGRAGPVLREVFGDCQVRAGPGVTTLRAEVAGPRALSGLVGRLRDFRLEITRIRLVTPAAR